MEETKRFDELVAKHHYLKSSVLVGEHMRYVATFCGEWLALGAWSTGAKHLKGRENLLTSLDAQRASGQDLKKIKRDYWGIDSKLHYRLDEVLDEDRSRVRNPNAALVLGMFRRVVSFAIPWSEKKQKTNKRTSTRDFFDHLRADKHRRAFDLVTAKAPSAWKK